MQNEKDEVININSVSVIHKLYLKKYWILSVVAITFILAYCYAASLPRYYQSNSMLAPEVDISKGGSGISSIASSFGIDMSSMQSTDAITPTLYPNLLEDNRFITNLFNTPITTRDAKTKCDYYTYLLKYQKHTWWSKGVPKDSLVENKNVSPYELTKQQDKIVKEIRNNIQIKVNSKDGVINISTTDQDQLVCRTLNITVITQLKQFITKYRTSKVIKDYQYYKKLADEARRKYIEARQIYGKYSDANKDIVLQSVQSKIEDLENDMQLKYNTYTSYNNQLQAAAAKVQERTPVFTMLKGAEVPIEPAGPKRMLFAFCLAILAFVITSVIILRNDIKRIFIL